MTFTVKQLIEHLKTFPDNIPVAYQLHSEAKLLELKEIKLVKMHSARADGWVHTFARSKESETVEYLLLPGN